MFISRIIYKICYNRITVNIKKRIRRKYWTWIVKNECKTTEDTLCVNYASHVTNKTILGSHVSFNGMEISGLGTVRIGDYFHSGKNCHIITHVHNYDNGDAIPYDFTYYHKDVTINNFVWLGEGVTILGGVTIGEGAIIQAYSTVVSDIPQYAIAGGHPAKVFKYRDIDHFELLKKEQKFH